MITRKETPADIRIKSFTEWVSFRDSDAIELYDGEKQIEVKVEHRAWVCPFCLNAVEYWLVNGMVAMGCGRSSMSWMGKSSDCCYDPKCQAQQAEWHQSKEVEGGAA